MDIVSVSVEGEDFTVTPPDVFQVIFQTETMTGTTLCDTCFIINDDNLEGDHSFDIRVQGVAPDLTGITVDPRNAIVDITDDEGERCPQPVISRLVSRFCHRLSFHYSCFSLQLKL